MMKFPAIDPVAIHLGPLQIHWYGIMYLIGFSAAWWLGQQRAKTNPDWNVEQIGDLIFYGALGAIIGGRMGYILFYDLASYLHSPLNIFKVWQGGMSFHGGIIGVAIALWLYGRRIDKGFFQVTDFVVPLVPIGLGAGRIGNFINGELWGRASDLPWAMVFNAPQAGNLTRHPSQLYEALLEGVLLFIIIWLYSRRTRPLMAVSGLFLSCYGLFRFLVEFTRMPDAHLGLIAFDWLSMGQVLSLPMIILGLILLGWAYMHNKPPLGQ